jgi:hypothetical protein
MPTNDELFSEALTATNLGRRLPDDATARSNPLLQTHKSLTEIQINAFRPFWDPKNERPDRLPILVDYIDSPLAGAWAFKYNDQYMISMTYSICFVLEFMFNYALSHRAFLPEIGNPEAEPDHLPLIPISTNFNDIIAGVHMQGLSPSDFIPRDQERRCVAEFLTFAAIRFLSAHEFRHVQAGHTDYYAINFRLNYISEYVSSSVDVDRMMKCQAMEWDCDRFAIHCLLEHCWATRLNAVQNPSRYAAFYQDPKLLLFLCITACSAFFRLFDDKTPPRAEWNTFTHPPSRNRREIIVIAGIMWAQLRDPQNFDKTALGDVITKYIDLIEIQLCYIWSCDYDADYSRLACQQAGPYEREIMATWQAIMGDLAKYSYVPLDPWPV